MKVVVEGERSEKEFPKLMINKNDDFLVLFSEVKKGTIISLGRCSSNFYTVGEYRKDFYMHNFVDFKGKITLEQ